MAKIKKDKIKHFVCGFLITSLLSPISLFIGIVVGIITAFAKEFIWDKWMKRGTFDWMDIWATLAGVSISTVAVYCIWGVKMYLAIC